MSEVAQVPQLRFPEFSGEWEEKRFDSLYPTVRNGFVGVATPYYVEEGVPYLQGKNIKSGAINRNGLVYINESFHQKSKKSQLRQNDIVMVQSGHVGECAVITEEFEDTNCHALLVSTPTHDIDSKFYINYFYSKFGRKKIYRITTGNTIKHILSSDLKIQTVSNPSYQEQQKIAAFLTAVDSKIEQLSKKQELLGEYKKGLMQQIFSQAIRFRAGDTPGQPLLPNGNSPSGSDFPNWEEKRLGDLCEITTGKLDANAMVEGGQYRFYTCAKEYYKIDDYAFDTDALIVSGNGANVGYIHHYQGKFNAYQRTYVLDSFTDNIIFVKFVLDEYLHKRIMKEKNEGNTPYIVMGTLTDMKINLPSFSEQTKIAIFLSSIDSKIEQVGKQLDESKQFKKALLQQMFV